jgi:hypothetical protein
MCCSTGVASTCLCTTTCDSDDDCDATGLDPSYEYCNEGDDGKMCAEDGFCS